MRLKALVAVVLLAANGCQDSTIETICPSMQASGACTSNEGDKVCYYGISTTCTCTFPPGSWACCNGGESCPLTSPTNGSFCCPPAISNVCHYPDVCSMDQQPRCTCVGNRWVCSLEAPCTPLDMSVPNLGNDMTRASD